MTHKVKEEIWETEVNTWPTAKVVEGKEVTGGVPKKGMIVGVCEYTLQVNKKHIQYHNHDVIEQKKEFLRCKEEDEGNCSIHG